MAGAEAVVAILVRGTSGGVERRLGLLEAGEGAVPERGHAGLPVPVIPDLIPDPSSSFGGLEAKTGMAISAWIERQPNPKPSRPEAIRRLIEKGLSRE